MGVRPYRASDLPDLRSICLRTGRAGSDASGVYSSDDLLPDVFLEPYVTVEPETAWVVDLDGPVGYLVASLDTRGFVERWEAQWAPEFARRHPAVAPGERWLHEWRPVPVAGYPAHLHIDLLPSAQGAGWGRRLMGVLGAAAVEARVPGIHLGMARDNLPARAFYERLGFAELGSDGDALVLGIDPHRLID